MANTPAVPEQRFSVFSALPRVCRREDFDEMVAVESRGEEVLAEEGLCAGEALLSTEVCWHEPSFASVCVC